MKRFLLSLLILCLVLALKAEDKAPELFDIQKELEAFEVKEVEEGDQETYGELEFYLVTGGPGSMVWENFGHSLILMVSPSSFPVAFDWGIFTFDESFFVNFAFGRLYYEAWETYGEYRIESLIADDRSVSILPLELDTKEKKNLYSFLMYSTEEENRTYLYDYFKDNCATRPRDIISWISGGELEEKLKSQKNTETLRKTVERHLSLSSFPVCWTISYLLGPEVDKESTVYDACFLPSRLEEEIAEWQGNESIEYYASQERADVPEKWSLKDRSLIMGFFLLLLPLLFLSGKRSLERTGDLLLGIVYLFFGILSSVLVFFALFTIHTVTYGNINVFIISPLAFVSSVAHFLSLGKRRRNKAIGISSAIMGAMALVTLQVRILVPSVIQDSISVFIPALMLYLSELVVSLLLSRRKDK